MTIYVKTTYRNILPQELKQWADRIFAGALAARDLTPAQLEEAKLKFTNGETVHATFSAQGGGMNATTSWRYGE